MKNPFCLEDEMGFFFG